ncbi:MAG: hypothetical protein JSC188_000814 [Candidatus Tokpelaia sp. JSC188]|nr:MAG: hypothetical protein JSC188_000814 [Candidatus Tokpelaia sp. JSC188]
MQASHLNQAGKELYGRTAIIAGNGTLPLTIATVLQNQGKLPFLIILRNESDPKLYAFEHCEISIAEFSMLIRSLKAARISNVVLAGGIRTRPYWRDLCIDSSMFRVLPRIFFSLTKGDDALLRAFIKLVEAYGFRIVGAHEVAPTLLAPKKTILTKKYPNRQEKHNIALAFEAARQLGMLDIGQGAVAVGGRVVALEGAEGTDNMLERIKQMRQVGSIASVGGVLVKVMKPNQEKRADLPTIGPKTVENAYQAKLCGIAVEADYTFILDLEKTIKVADQYGMFIKTL